MKKYSLDLILFLIGHDVTECSDGDICVCGSLKGPIVPVVLDDVLKVADYRLEEVGQILVICPIKGRTQSDERRRKQTKRIA